MDVGADRLFDSWLAMSRQTERSLQTPYRRLTWALSLREREIIRRKVVKRLMVERRERICLGTSAEPSKRSLGRSLIWLYDCLLKSTCKPVGSRSCDLYQFLNSCCNEGCCSRRLKEFVLVFVIYTLNYLKGHAKAMRMSGSFDVGCYGEGDTWKIVTLVDDAFALSEAVLSMHPRHVAQMAVQLNAHTHQREAQPHPIASFPSLLPSFLKIQNDST